MLSRSRRNDTLDVVRHLVTVIGPRQATSLAEAQAAAYVDGRLRRAGMRVNADTFRAATHAGLTYPLLALLGLSAALLTRWLPLPSLLLALWGFLLTLGDALVAPLPSLALQRDSQNIVGTRASEKAPNCRVVLLAPLDSYPDRTGLYHFLGQHRVAFVSRMVVFGLLTLLVLLQAVAPNEIWWYGQILPAVYLLLLLLPRRVRLETSPGGAGALAVLLSVAEQLQTLQTVELWTVALGATATGSSGVRDLLARYPFPVAQTLFLNLEHIDSGQLTYASREGVVRQHAADAQLVRLAALIDTQDTLINAEPRPYRTTPSLATLFFARGYRVLSILSHTEENVSISDDRPLANLDAHMLERATRLVVGIVHQLDQEQRDGAVARHSGQ
jgi:hypothetical protein